MGDPTQPPKTSVPNLVRALVIPISIGIQMTKASFGLVPLLKIVGTVAIVLAFMAVIRLKETFHEPLDFLAE